MALTKVTKHVVHGSLLVQFKYQDLSDISTSSTGWTNFGSSLTITPKYADSILEQNFGGTQEMDEPGDDVDLRIRLLVNGQEEYYQGEMMGAYAGGNSYRHHGTPGDRAHHHFGNMHDLRKSMGFNHAFKPGNTNAQVHQVQGQISGGRQYFMRDGFLVVKEISSGLGSTPAG
jgi:hypothetical protein